MNFQTLREKYPTIIYNSYEIIENDDNYQITFDFEIPSLTHFNPSLTIYKKDIKNDINSSIAKEIIFNIGMVELISYFKATCSKNVIVKAGYLDDNQKQWFKKLFYYGLGEFMYVNDIHISEDELLEFDIQAKKTIKEDIKYQGSGNLIPVGGGKDSTVTLELLKGKDNTCFAINPKIPHEECIKIAGYSNYMKVARTIDKNLLELNKQGFLNGHTPFSSLVAFITYLCAYLLRQEG